MKVGGDGNLVERRIIVMQPGPLHLFWTTGVFYFWALKDRFDFIFIVMGSYSVDDRFIKLMELDSVRHVEILPQSDFFTRQFIYSRKIKKLLGGVAIEYFLLNNHSYIENQYLIYWASRFHPAKPRFYYQNGREACRWESDFKARQAVATEKLVDRFHLLAIYPELALAISNLFRSIKYSIQFNILPLLIIQFFFRPPINVVTGEVDYRSMRRLVTTGQDFILSYLVVETEVYRDMGCDSVIRIKHPLSPHGYRVFDFFYHDTVESETILLVPSYGFTALMLRAGWTVEGLVEHLSERWIKAINLMLKEFPGYYLKMKLHPASIDDSVWARVIVNIQRKFPSLEIIDPRQSAEQWVIRSKVIVGDVTTVLWWAALLGGKVVISLDIFEYPSGDEMALYGRAVNYVKDLGQVTAFSKSDVQEADLDVHELFQ